MSALSTLFKQFLRHRRYLQNVTPKALTWYQNAFDAFTRTVEADHPQRLSKSLLQDFVVRLRERGLSPVSCNTYLKVINAFVGWLQAEGHLRERLSLAAQRTEKRVVQTLTDAQLQRLLGFKATSTAQWRAYALVCTLTDTGVRIEEALGLRRTDVDFDNLLLKVRGKGRKERIIPFSFALRRVLCRWEQVTQRQRWASDLLFPTRAGTRLGLRNALGQTQFAVMLGEPRHGEFQGAAGIEAGCAWVRVD